jgi:hypothetical protein
MIGRKDAAAKATQLRFCPEHRRFYSSKSAFINHRRCSESQVEFESSRGKYKTVIDLFNSDLTLLDFMKEFGAWNTSQQTMYSNLLKSK